MIMISSGHGLFVRGASHPDGLDEVDEARRVVDRLQEILGDVCKIFHDDTSNSQDENLHTIVSAHNKHPAAGRTDVSVHFNAYTYTEGGRGVEVCYLTQQQLADRISHAISNAGGLINRGSKKRSDLYFLNKTTGSEGAVLLEVCFVDAMADVEAYQSRFNAVCSAIAHVLLPGDEVEAEEEYKTIKIRGKCSSFGGPDDMGVESDEGLAFLYEYSDKPEVFLDEQPPGTTGLARRLNADGVYYIAMRFDYDVHSKEMLRGDVKALVRSPKTGRQFEAHPTDWGPHHSTGRTADLSPALMSALGIVTDDEVEVTFPAP
jgi:N-acetylmuramoyl-L-alanine amidase